MLLLVDIGNSRIKWNTARDKVLLGKTQSFSWQADLLHDQLLQSWQSLEDISAVWVSNVVGESAAKAINHYCRQRWGLEARYAQTKARQCDVVNAYADHSRLGVDRWLALLATWNRVHNNPACIIDCGTAITVDLITDKGEHLGGAIAPGARLMQQALSGKSTAIQVAIAGQDSDVIQHWQQQISHYPGTSTQECINIGSWHASAGFIRIMIEKAQQVLSNDCRIVITGGDASFMLNMLKQTPAQITQTIVSEPDLVLHGLLICQEDTP